MTDRDGLVIGVDIGGTKVSACTADAAGHVLARSERRADRSGRPAAESVPRAIDAARDCVRRAGADDAVPVLGLGLVTPGVVTGGGIALAPNNPGIAGADPARALAEALGADEAAWTNDVKAAALADHAWGSLRGASTGVFVNVGTGLSAGAVVDGRPLLGQHGAALEIGSLLPRRDGPVRGAREGGAPLEDRVSGRALHEAARAAGREDLSASDLIVRAHAADADPRDPLTPLGREAVDEITRALVTLAIVLDPGIISLGGGVITRETGSVLLPALRAELERFVPYPPEVAVTSLGADASLLGALLIGYQQRGGGVPSEVRSMQRQSTGFDVAG
jgi:glucokinase